MFVAVVGEAVVVISQRRVVMMFVMRVPGETRTRRAGGRSDSILAQTVMYRSDTQRSLYGR